jgi:nitrous oxidase accessory protein
MFYRGVLTIGVAAFVAILAPSAWGAVVRVAADNASLQAVIDRTLPGDVITLETGEHAGPITINKTLTLEGEPGAVITGNGKGSVIKVEAPQTVIRGLEIKGSGKNLFDMDSGIFLAQTARGARVEGNAILGNLVGVYIHGAENSLIKGNRIVGLREGRTSEAGDGVSVWNAPGAQVVDNEISYGRDGIFTKTSKQNIFKGNMLKSVRFGIHYMYTNNSEISQNISLGNTVGYAIMFSDRLQVTGNVSDGDRDHGLLLNYANGSTISGNIVRGRELAIQRWTAAARIGG